MGIKFKINSKEDFTRLISLLKSTGISWRGNQEITQIEYMENMDYVYIDDNFTKRRFSLSYSRSYSSGRGLETNHPVFEVKNLLGFSLKNNNLCVMLHEKKTSNISK